MSSVLSAQPAASLVDMDLASDPVNTPSKSFPRDPSSSSSPPSNLHPSSPKLSPSRSPPLRPSKLEQISPASGDSSALANGHESDHAAPTHQFPSQASPQDKEDGEHTDRSKEDPEWEDQRLPLGAEGDEDPEYEAGDGDGDWAQDEIEADIRRVKVYELIDQKWTDRGTAFCQGDYLEKLREAKLVARAEHTNEVLLECTIRSTDVYQRQQDTLIVWTEPDGTDYALSFQDIEGCAEVWEFILEVQRHLKEKDEESSNSEGSSSMNMLSTGTMNPFSLSNKLPVPALGNMPECERAIRNTSRVPHEKEKLCDVLVQMDYVKQVIDVMKQAENLEDIKELHACCSCMQTILMLNDHNLLEYVLQDHIFHGMVGVLEYDPEFPRHKAFYRDFLEKCTQFRQPIPIREPTTRHKIEQTYRLQFLKDVVLARATDDATFNVLNSCIIFNQIDIVNQVQHDERFLREIVGLFLTKEQDFGKDNGKDASKIDDGSIVKGKQQADEGDAMAVDEPKINGADSVVLTTLETSPAHVPASLADLHPSSEATQTFGDEYSIDDRRKDTILLIQQLCLMGKNVQLPARLQLFRTLVDRGILHAIQWAISRPERQMVSTAGEVLTVLLDHDVNGVRQHVMKQVGMLAKPAMGMGMSVGVAGVDSTGPEAKRETLLETLCRLLITSNDLAYKSQMADALRAVLEVPQTDNTDTANMALRAIARAKDDPITERFLEYFYSRCCEGLFRPVSDLSDHRKLTGSTVQLSRERSNLYLYLCDLLSSFALQHSYRSHFFILSNSGARPPLVPRIASLLRSKEKHLRLAALRFFRALLKLANRNMTLHLISCDVIVRILELVEREAKWDNLLSSCCQEFFEHIRRENVKELLTHLMTKYQSKVVELSQSPVCGQRFQALIRRWEMNTEPPPNESDKPQAASTPVSQKWGQGRLLEQEEEEYFNNSDDEDGSKSAPWQTPSLAPAPLSSLKRKRGKGFSTSTLSPPSKQQRKSNAPPILPLVDYEDEEGEESGSGDASLFNKSDEISAAPEVSSQSRSIDWFSQRPPPMVVSVKRPSDSSGGSSGAVSLVAATSRSGRLSSPPRLAEKRRKLEEEDEADELLERLVRSKRQEITPSSPEMEPSKPAPIRPAPLGKMKLKIGVTSLSMGSSSSGAGPPDSSGKDVDGG